ncbi:MAG TPA: hypothetical protein VNN08_09595 [Thermoanaerobaculia bacterium]|nr:hypothetical protein [Thermoanaerobaculia bacterium]
MRKDNQIKNDETREPSRGESPAARGRSSSPTGFPGGYGPAQGQGGVKSGSTDEPAEVGNREPSREH